MPAILGVVGEELLRDPAGARCFARWRPLPVFVPASRPPAVGLSLKAAIQIVHSCSADVAPGVWAGAAGAD